MNTNKISAVISAADLTTATGHITSLNTLFPWLQNISAEDVKKIKRVADSRLPFITKALTYAQQHPEVLPGTFNLAEFAKDVAWLNNFVQFLAVLETFHDKCLDTRAIGEYEADQQARDVYDIFKRANRGGEYTVIVNDLGSTFEGMGKNKAKAKTPSAA